jgi:hypothetical protein
MPFIVGKRALLQKDESFPELVLECGVDHIVRRSLAGHAAVTRRGGRPNVSCSPGPSVPPIWYLRAGTGMYLSNDLLP